MKLVVKQVMTSLVYLVLLLTVFLLRRRGIVSDSAFGALILVLTIAVTVAGFLFSREKESQG